jgi:hypothetical protein
MLYRPCPRAVLAATAALASLFLSSAVLADDDIPVNELPPEIVRSIEARFPGARIEEAERDTRDGRPLFEVEIVVNGDDKELTITPDGTIVDIDD